MDIRFYFFWVISKQGDARLCDMCMLNFGRNSETGFWAVGPSTFLAALYELQLLQNLINTWNRQSCLL